MFLDIINTMDLKWHVSFPTHGGGNTRDSFITESVRKNM